MVATLTCAGCQRLPPAINQIIQDTVETETLPASIKREKERERAWDVMRRFYHDRQFQPAWLTIKEARPQVQELLKAIDDSAAEGLDPQLYQREHLERLLQEVENTESYNDPEAQRRLAHTDIHLTFTFLTLAAHMATGRIRPGSPRSEWDLLEPREVNLDAPLQKALEDEENLDDALRALRHPGDEYKRLLEAHARYREIAARGGWRKIAPAARLKPGMRSESVGRLKDRLRAEGDLPALQEGETEDDVFDNPVTAAVERFQRRYGLEATGEVAEDTLKAMNVSAAQRVRQFEMNLERWRWMPADFGERYIRVNIPELEMALIDHGEQVLEMRVVVGEDPENRTPVFSHEMNHLVLNPWWIIPQEIVEQEIRPQAARNPGYLVSHSYIEREVEGRTRLCQRPGPNNSLGQVKFMFPNKYNVYFHDTPAKHHFRQAKRDLSHGCIRLEHPMKLVHVLLEGSEWTPEMLRETLASGNEKRIDLPHALPVHLLYFTTWANKDGSVHFRRDIYGHDDRLGRSLAAEPIVKLDLDAV